MLLRYVCGGKNTDVELFGAQSESLIGIYDAVRSSVLDITADAIVMRESSAAGLAAFKSAGKDPAALVEQIAASALLAGGPVDLYLVDKTKAGSTSTLFMQFPEGLGALAEAIAGDTATFARDLISGIGITDGAVQLLSGVDQEYAPDILPTVLHRPLPVDVELDDLPVDEPTPAPAVKVKKAKAI